MDGVAVALLQGDQFRGRSPERLGSRIHRGLLGGLRSPDLLEGLGDVRAQPGLVLLMPGQFRPVIVKDGLPFQFREAPPLGQQAG
jgi:hypothetical protein